MNKKIRVHPGVIHPDELVACGLLILNEPNVEFGIIRTRDSIPTDYTVDVDEEYDEVSKFDTHQFTKDSEYYGLSSSGLVYRYVKKSLHSSDMDNFIKALNVRDTRVGFTSNSVYDNALNAITKCNSINPDSKEQEEIFTKLLDLVTRLIKSILIKNVNKYTEAVKELEELAKSSDEKNNVFRFREANVKVIDNALICKFYPNWRKISRKLKRPFIIPGDVNGQYKILADTNVVFIATANDLTFLHPRGFLAVVEPKNGLIEVILSTGELLSIEVSKVQRILDGII